MGKTWQQVVQKVGGCGGNNFVCSLTYTVIFRFTVKDKYVKKAFGEKLYYLMGKIEMPLNFISFNSVNDRAFYIST